MQSLSYTVIYKSWILFESLCGKLNSHKYPQAHLKRIFFTNVWMNLSWVSVMDTSDLESIKKAFETVFWSLNSELFTVHMNSNGSDITIKMNEVFIATFKV